MQQTSKMMLANINYKLGKNANARIVHHCDQTQILLETLNQSSNPTRFYHAFEETFLFVLKGELFLKKNQDDILLKSHQGTLLPRDTTIIATLLQPNVELCFIKFLKAPPSAEECYFKKVSSGTVQAQPSRLGMMIWPLWQGKQGMIAINLYPAGYNEPSYYHKETQQFLLPLNGELSASINKQPPKPISEQGLFFTKRIPKSVLNLQQESIAALCVFTPFPEKGRIILLSTKKKP